MKQQRRDWLRLSAALALASALPLCALGAPGAASAPGAPDADEAPPFETLDLDWADIRRQRPVPVRLYLPQAVQAVPLLVFSSPPLTVAPKEFARFPRPPATVL